MVPSDPRGGTRVHDFHPPISASGLFWTIPIPEGSCTFGADGKSASVEVKNIAIVDQPNFPDRMPTTPGTLLHMRVTWTATAQPAHIEDAKKVFVFEGRHAEAQLEFEVSVPLSGFRWKSDPLATSSAKFAVLGKESNGRYYPKPMPDVVGLKENVARGLLGNLSITNTVAASLGHEALGDAYKHDLTTAVVTATEPAAGVSVAADARVVLHVKGE